MADFNSPALQPKVFVIPLDEKTLEAIKQRTQKRNGVVKSKIQTPKKDRRRSKEVLGSSDPKPAVAHKRFTEGEFLKSVFDIHALPPREVLIPTEHNILESVKERSEERTGIVKCTIQSPKKDRPITKEVQTSSDPKTAVAVEHFTQGEFVKSIFDNPGPQPTVTSVPTEERFLESIAERIKKSSGVVKYTIQSPKKNWPITEEVQTSSDPKTAVADEDFIQGEFLKSVFDNRALQPRVVLMRIKQSILESVKERSEERTGVVKCTIQSPKKDRPITKEVQTLSDPKTAVAEQHFTQREFVTSVFDNPGPQPTVTSVPTEERFLESIAERIKKSSGVVKCRVQSPKKYWRITKEVQTLIDTKTAVADEDFIQGEFLKSVFNNRALQPRVVLMPIEQNILESVKKRSKESTGVVKCRVHIPKNNRPITKEVQTLSDPKTAIAEEHFIQGEFETSVFDNPGPQPTVVSIPTKKRFVESVGERIKKRRKYSKLEDDHLMKYASQKELKDVNSQNKSENSREGKVDDVSKIGRMNLLETFDPQDLSLHFEHLVQLIDQEEPVWWKTVHPVTEFPKSDLDLFQE